MNKLGTLLTISAVAVALTAPVLASSKNMSGAYLGASFGYGIGELHSRMKSNTGLSTNMNPSMKGMIGGLHLGFQKDFGRFVAGVEGAGNLSNTKTSDSFQVGALSIKNAVKRKNALNAAGRFGVKLNDWLVYAKGGYENAKFSSDSKSKRVNGLLAGLGFETVTCNHVMFGGEYTYTMYKRETFKTTTNGIQISRKIQPRIGDFKLRLGYKL
jgi:opacity protein-like surface antigen